MGEVYGAYDPELDRAVAIKRVRGGAGTLGGERLRDALMRDARSAAQLQHPHVVEIYDVGVEGDDLYMVMELVEGPSLAQWLKQGPRPWRAVVEMFVAVGRGLACAHAHDIVHRDFKPANVLIGRDGRPRVADFGLAQITDDLRRSREDQLVATLDEHAEIAGTPQYMAPEQYWATEVGPAADQFAFCNALYRALYGVAPFEGDTVRRLATNVSEGRVRPPPARSGVPRALAQAVRCGLKADPARRHRSMDALIERLRSILAHRYWVLGSVGGAALMLGAALVGHHAWPAAGAASPCEFVAEPWASRQRERLEHSLGRRTSFGAPAVEAIMRVFDRHAARWAEARTEACAATRIRGEQSGELMDLRFECLARQRALFSSVFEQIGGADGPVMDNSLKLIEELPPASDCGAEPVRRRASMSGSYELDLSRARSPELRAERQGLAARLGRARAEFAATRYTSALRGAAAVADRATAMGARELLAEALLLEGASGLHVARTGDDRRTALRTLDRALWVAIRSGSMRLVTRAHIAEANAALHRRPTDARLFMHLDIAWAYASTLPDAETLLARVELVRGRVAMKQGRADEAIEHLERVRQRVPESPLSRLARGDLANVHLMRGELGAAREQWQSLRAELEALSPADPLLGWALHNLAVVALRDTDYDEALSLARRAEHLYEASPASDPRELQRVRIRIGRALRLMDSPQSARRILRGVIETLGPMGFAGHESMLEALDEMVEVEFDRGDYAAAARVAQRWLEVALVRSRAEDPDVARARMMLAKAAHGAGELVRARAQIALAYEHRHGMSAVLQAEVSFYYAQITHEQGSREAAAGFYDETTRTLAQERATEHVLAMVRRWGRPRGYEREPADE